MRHVAGGPASSRFLLPEQIQDGPALKQTLFLNELVGVRPDGGVIFFDPGQSSFCPPEWRHLFRMPRVRMLKDGIVTTIMTTPRDRDVIFTGRLCPRGESFYVHHISQEYRFLAEVNLKSRTVMSPPESTIEGKKIPTVASNDDFVVIYERRPGYRDRLAIVNKSSLAGDRVVERRLVDLRSRIKWSFEDEDRPPFKSKGDPFFCTSIVASPNDHTFYMLEAGAVIRRLDPRTEQVTTVLDLSNGFTGARNLVVGFDDTVFFTTNDGKNGDVLLRVDGGDVCPTVVPRSGNYRSIASMALDDVRGVLYMMINSGSYKRVFAVSVPSAAARRRERLQRLGLLFRLSDVGRAEYQGYPGFFEALRTSWGGRDPLVMKATKQGAYWSKWARGRRSDRTLRLLVDFSRRYPVIISLISRFLF